MLRFFSVYHLKDQIKDLRNYFICYRYVRVKTLLKRNEVKREMEALKAFICILGLTTDCMSVKYISNITKYQLEDDDIDKNITNIDNTIDVVNIGTNNSEVIEFEDKTKEVIIASDNKCANIDHADLNEPSFEIHNLNSVYLNNIHSSVTGNLIEDNVSIESIEADGVNLFDIIRDDCGSAKMCSNIDSNWTSENTITIGFLGAYGYSLVSLKQYGVIKGTEMRSWSWVLISS